MRTRYSIALLFALLYCLPLLALPINADTHDHSDQQSDAFMHQDALLPPPPPPSLAGYDDDRGLSQFMAGRVAVQVVLPESNGSAEPSSEDWTPAQIDAVTREVQTGLDWWAQQLPLARLSFTLDVKLAPTAYEPITHALGDEGLWISDSLAALGQRSGTYFDRAYNAGYALRQQQGSDWSTTIFVVNSAHNSSGRFADNRFAYAYIGGPFMVLTSDAGPYGADQLAPVVAHELGHIFGALDQYRGAQVPCDERSGYLDVPSSNSQIGGCPTNVPSIMLDILPAYSLGAIDPSARAQVGYRDSNNDGVIDPLRTTPKVQLQPAATLQAGQRPRFSGRSTDLGYPSPNQIAVSLNHIARVEYRANGGPWQQASPDDGNFDSADEAFSVEAPLYDGTYLIEFQAINSIGTASPLTSASVTVDGVGPQPAYRVSAPTLSKTRDISLALEAPIDTQAVQVSADPWFKGAAWQPYTPALSYQLATNNEGTQQIYVRFRDAAGIVSLAYPLQVQIDTLPPSGRAYLRAGSPPRVVVQANDAGSGVTAMQLEFAGNVGGWQTYQAELTLPAEPAELRVRLRDAAGNVSAAIAPFPAGQIFVPLVSGN